MIDQLLSQGTGISIILIIGIVIAFIIAFKIMEMVFETVLVSILSGGFYLTLRYLQGGPMSLNDALLFSFLGATLYMVYSLAASLYKVASTVIPLPYRIAKALAEPFEDLWNKYREHQKKKSYVNRDSKEEKQEEKSKTTKEVILGNKEEDEDED